MGLDMTIYSEKHAGVEIAYWRKHPNLHGYIVQTFADGVDECQEIDLDRDKIIMILGAIGLNNLPETTGFFFGSSEHHTKEEDAHLLNGVLRYMKNNPEARVYYEASW